MASQGIRFDERVQSAAVGHALQYATKDFTATLQFHNFRRSCFLLQITHLVVDLIGASADHLMDKGPGIRCQIML